MFGIESALPFSPDESYRPRPIHWTLLLLFIFLMAACSPSVQAPAHIESTAFTLVDEILELSLDSHQAPGASYQHADLNVLRFASKTLSPDAVANDITALWCVNVAYRISAADSTNAKNWHEAEFVILVYEHASQGLGGGEWDTQSSKFSYGSIANYNAAAWQDCLTR